MTYKVTDNSGSFTGRGWRVSGRGGFWVYSDHQEKLAQIVAGQMNIADASARKAVAKVLRNQATLLRKLNGPNVPTSFVEKHNIEAAILEHAATVCERGDLDWNKAALDAMEKFVTEQAP